MFTYIRYMHLRYRFVVVTVDDCRRCVDPTTVLIGGDVVTLVIYTPHHTPPATHVLPLSTCRATTTFVPFRYYHRCYRLRLHVTYVDSPFARWTLFTDLPRFTVDSTFTDFRLRSTFARVTPRYVRYRCLLVSFTRSRLPFTPHVTSRFDWF